MSNTTLKNKKKTIDIGNGTGEVITKSSIDHLDLSWLVFAAPVYHISPNINDYVLVNTIITISDLPNRNGIAFPLTELVGFAEPPNNRLAYQGWLYAPTFYNHCFTGETLISTPSGVKQIKDIKVGDDVYTHRNRVRKVKQVFNNGEKETYHISASGLIQPLNVTENHPLMVVDCRQIINDSKVKPHWRNVSDIYEGDYLACPILIGGSISIDKSFAFLLGLYAAVGTIKLYQNDENSSCLRSVKLDLHCADSSLISKIADCCDALGYSYKIISYQSNCATHIFIENSEFVNACDSLIGQNEATRQMKGELRQWNKESITQFLSGYFSSDNFAITNKPLCTTQSINLAIDIQHALAFIGIAASARKIKVYSSRLCTSYSFFDEVHDAYEVSMPSLSNLCDVFIKNDSLCTTVVYSSSSASSDKAIIKGNLLLFPISSICKNANKETVYNLEVEEDHTYLANTIIAHNCNEDCTKAKGAVFDVALRKVKGYGNDKLWKVTGILGFDKTKDPELAEKIATGKINTYSMGALADSFTCSYCGEECTDQHCCEHITSVSAVNFNQVKDYAGNTHIAFLNAHGLSPIEVSAVEDPAWAPALSSNIILNKSDDYSVSTDKQQVVSQDPYTKVFDTITFNY